MSLIARILIGLQGLGSAIILLGIWLSPSQMGKMSLMVEPVGLVGNATIRADIGGLFAGLAIMLVMAAWKQSRMWALGALVLAGCALAGRLISVVADGSGPGIWAPIGIEAFAIATLLWARNVWRTPA